MIGDLPPSYEAWRTRTPWDDEPEHYKDCPCHEDHVDACPTQEESGECYCDDDCRCAERERQGRAAAAEARMDAQRGN